MNPKETLKKVKTLLGVEVALEQMKLDNGTIIEAEVFEAENDVFIVNDDEKIALPVGQYTLEDGKILIVETEGVISEIKEAEAEEEETPAEEAAPEAATEPEMEAQPTAKKVIESISKEMFFEEIEKLRSEIAEIKLSKIEATEEVKEVELSEEANPIIHNPEVKIEKEINLFAQKRPQTTKDRVFNKLFNN
jgi:phosphoribosylformylglycinamidine (FGAM) synthase PurS component